MKKTIILVFGILMLISCQNQVILENQNNDAESLATQYFNMQLGWENLSCKRSVYSTEQYPEFLNKVEMHDENGNKVVFSELTEEQKKIFFDTWKQYNIEHMTKIIEENENVKKIVEIENEIFYDIANQHGRNIESEKDVNKFYEKYQKVREKYYKDMISTEFKNQRSSSSSGTIQNVIPDDIVLSSASCDIFRNNYGKGRVLICSDSSSDSGSSSAFLGHAALMHKNEIKEDEILYSSSQYSVSAWPNDGKTTTWTGKINGVQYEPLGYWAGNYSGAANNVEIYEMNRISWEVGILTFLLGFPIAVHRDASPDEANRAVEFALGRVDVNKASGLYPYNVVNTIVQVASGNPIQSKWHDSTCYCSQFVWRSWCAANIGFDFSGTNPWILPVDFQLTSQTKKIASYKNK